MFVKKAGFLPFCSKLPSVVCEKLLAPGDTSWTLCSAHVSLLQNEQASAADAEMTVDEKKAEAIEVGGTEPEILKEGGNRGGSLKRSRPAGLDNSATGQLWVEECSATHLYFIACQLLLDPNAT